MTHKSRTNPGYLWASRLCSPARPSRKWWSRPHHRGSHLIIKWSQATAKTPPSSYNRLTMIMAWPTTSECPRAPSTSTPTSPRRPNSQPIKPRSKWITPNKTGKLPNSQLQAIWALPITIKLAFLRNLINKCRPKRGIMDLGRIARPSRWWWTRWLWCNRQDLEERRSSREVAATESSPIRTQRSRGRQHRQSKTKTCSSFKSKIQTPRSNTS